MENFSIKINLTKIDKSLLFKSEKTGAIYLDAFAIASPNNKYGQSHMIVQSMPKDRREAGEKGEILGNMEVSETKSKESAPIDENDTGLPF